MKPFSGVETENEIGFQSIQYNLKKYFFKWAAKMNRQNSVLFKSKRKWFNEKILFLFIKVWFKLLRQRWKAKFIFSIVWSVFSPIRHQKIVMSHTSIILLDNRTLDLNLEFKSQNWLIITNLVTNTWIT